MPTRARLSTLVAGVLLLLGGAAAVIGMLFERQASALSSGGVESTARVEQLVMHGSGTGKRYRAVVSLGAGVRRHFTVSDTEFRQLQVGDPLIVTHPPGRPDEAQLGERAVQRSAALHARAAQWGGAAAFAVGVLLALRNWLTRAAQRSAPG